MCNIALDKNKKPIEPSPGVRGTCYYCGEVVTSVCGALKKHHFRHIQENSTCTASKMTAWHYGWQEIVDPSFRATEITKGKHRADIWHPKGYAIEIQHSPIDDEDVYERTQDYKKIIWLLDYTQAKRNNNTADIVTKFKMDNMFNEKKNNVFIDLGDGFIGAIIGFEQKTVNFKKITKEKFIEAVYGTILKQEYKNQINMQNDFIFEAVSNATNIIIDHTTKVKEDCNINLGNIKKETIHQVNQLKDILTSHTCSVTAQALDHIQTIAKQHLRGLFPVYEEELTKRQKDISVWVKNVHENNNDIPQKYKSLNQIKQLFTPLSLDEKIIFSIYFPDFNVDWKPNK